MHKLDIQTARRFVLGKQGLWPGRRWSGLEGTEAALRGIEHLQLDPLQVVARSHDIALYSRVIGYKPGDWEKLAYGQRKFFDWGGWLSLRPMEELPYWRVVMKREPETDNRIKALGRDHAEAIDEMRVLLRERGTLSNRDFDINDRIRTQSYRGRKDSALALHYLWRVGDVMTHHREQFERVYALTETVAPAALISESGDDEAERFILKKEISFNGFTRIARVADAYFRGVPFTPSAAKNRTFLLDSGEISEVQIDGIKQTHYALSSDLTLIEELAAGRIPDQWKVLDTTTAEEAVILAPLDQVSARGRAKILFGFDYVWEVYKKEEQRKYGYYTMPILWEDRLVARFDSKLDRAAKTLQILGFWLEDVTLENDQRFVEAIGRCFDRFALFLDVLKIDATTVREQPLRKRLENLAGAAS